MIIGAQLYTVRDHCKTLSDFSETLKKIADIGYTTVQVSGSCEYDPAWLKTELDKNGLKCVLTHISKDKLTSDPVAVAKAHDVFDCDCVGLGGFHVKDEDGKRYSDFLSTYPAVAKALSDNGKYFMYHNHAHEFRKIDGKLILQKLADDVDAKLMGFTLDTYWVQVGGGDPAEWIKKLSGRVPCIHLKDCAFEQKMSVVGEGNINFERVFCEAEKAGTKYMLVEQDNCYGEDPFECLKRSYNNLKNFGFR